MSGPTHNSRNFFSDQPDPSRSPTPARDPEQTWFDISTHLREYMAGDEQALHAMRAMLYEGSLAEQTVMFQRIEQTVEAYSPPHTLARARAAFTLAQLAAVLLPDNGQRLFQRAEDFAEGCDNCYLQREALLRRAALLYDGDKTGQDVSRARELAMSSLRVRTEGAPGEFFQFIRAYTLVGKCYLADECGSADKEALDSAYAIEGHLFRNRDRVAFILAYPQSVSRPDLEAVVESIILLARTQAIGSNPHKSRQTFDRLLTLDPAQGPLSAWAHAKGCLSCATSLRERSMTGNAAVSDGSEDTPLDEALRLLSQARKLFESGTLSDGFLFGQVLYEEGRIHFETAEIAEARECFLAARDQMMSEAEGIPVALNLIPNIVDMIEECEGELELRDGADGAEDERDTSE